MLSHYTGLPLPLHRPPQSPQPSQKDNNPSPCTTTLASLVKGRWLDGTTQTVALLRPTCDMSALFILQTFQPSRRRDCLSCIDPLHPHNHCKKTIVPCSALNLPPLSKVRCRRPKEFGRLPEGLSHQPFAPHHPFKNRTILRKSPTPLPPLSKGGGLTARHKLLSCCVLIATHLPFLFTKLFCRQDGGIVSVASTLSIPTTLAKGQ